MYDLDQTQFGEYHCATGTLRMYSFLMRYSSARWLTSHIERITKTDLAYLATGGFWLTIDQIAGALIAFVLSIAFAHFVAPEVYGTYRYLIATFWTLAAFTLTGIPTALSQAVARGYDGALKRSFRWSLLGGIPLFFIALAMSGYYFIAGNSTLSLGLLAIALLGPLVQPAHLFGPYLAGKKDFRMMTILGVIFSLIPAVCLLGGMYVTADPLSFFLIYLAANVVTGLGLCVLTIRIYRPHNTINTDFRSLSGHFSLMNLLSTIAAQIDKLVVFHYLGAVELAVYSFAVAMPEQVKGMLGAVSVLALPKFATRSIQDIRQNFWNRLLLFSGILLLASLAYILIAPLAFDIFFPKYTSAVVYSQLFALSLILTSVSLPNTLLQAKGAKRELYAFNIISPVFQITALILLTALYGLLGTIIARIIGRAFSLLLCSLLAYLYIKRS